MAGSSRCEMVEYLGLLQGADQVFFFDWTSVLHGIASP